MIKIDRPGRFVVFLLSVALFLAVIIFGLLRLIMGPSTIQRTGSLTIAEGSPASSVWQQAVDQELTPRALPWRYHAWRQDAESGIKAGTYQVTAGEKISEVMRRLVAGTTDAGELTVTFPEGFTMQQMAARVASRGLATEDEFVQAAAPSLYAAEVEFVSALPPGRDLEGYLFPDTYRLAPDDTARDVVGRMLANFTQKFSPDLASAASARSRTMDQIIIMASIIEREVISDDDMAQVAGVLWRRFDDGVGLAADATLRYALDKWDSPLTVADLSVDSTYNTRKYAGLPPGPISNPGLRAIMAASNPTESGYYYYLSTPEGETIFSKTLDEHNLNKAKYLR